MAWSKSETRIIKDCVESLRTLSGVKVHLDQSFPLSNDAILEISGDWGKKRYLIEAKLAVTPRSVDPIQHHITAIESTNILLMTSYVNPRLGKELQERRIEYVDTVGNMYVTSSPLHINVTGKKPNRSLSQKKRTFHTKALQLIYILLLDPNSVNWSYRELARSADVALGSIGRTLTELRTQGFLVTSSTGQKKLVGWRRLLERWETAYLDVLRPGVLLARARLPKDGFDKILQEASGKTKPSFYLGGELGAATVTGYLAPLEATLHVTENHQEVMRSLKLIPDKKGPVHLLRTWGECTSWQEAPGEIALADPILMHAELLGNPDDRLREAALMLLENQILPRVDHDDLRNRT